MKTLRCSDSALIAVAQDVVDRWRSRPHGTFLEAIGDLERSPWPGMALSPGQRQALRKICNMIRTGHGDAATNPRPLHRVLETYSARERSVA
jgi:hypothetical protein